jgi:hypothetical protein
MTESGKGASKSSPILILPVHRPGLRGLLDKGTSFATGRPALAITISSPFITRSMMRESCAFGSFGIKLEP